MAPKSSKQSAANLGARFKLALNVLLSSCAASAIARDLLLVWVCDEIARLQLGNQRVRFFVNIQIKLTYSQPRTPVVPLKNKRSLIALDLSSSIAVRHSGSGFQDPAVGLSK